MFLLSTVIESMWLSANSTLPRSDYGFAVGTYNNNIFIVGGKTNQKQLIEYEISTDRFFDYGTDALNISDIYTISASTQNRELLYIILNNAISDESMFATFNTITKQYTEKWKDITMDTYVGIDACLASSDEYLFVIGGNTGYYLNTLQILNLSTHEWVNDAPAMNDDRSDHACVVSNDYLWAFAGWGGVEDWELKSNERIHISNILQNQWQYIQNLSLALYAARAVVTKGRIYVVGGLAQAQNLYIAQDIVHIVDPDTGAVNVSSDRLSYGVYGFGVTVYNARICVFGGRSGGSLDSWMYNQLPTTSPTYNPTFNPSSVTVDPTLVPTPFPTISNVVSYIEYLSTTSSPTSGPQNAGNTESIYKPETESSRDWLSIIIGICIAVLCTFILVVSVLFVMECRKSKRDNKYVIKAVKQNVFPHKQQIQDDNVCDKQSATTMKDDDTALETVRKDPSIADEVVSHANVSTKGEGLEGVGYDIANDEFEVVAEDGTTTVTTKRKNELETLYIM